MPPSLIRAVKAGALTVIYTRWASSSVRNDNGCECAGSAIRLGSQPPGPPPGLGRMATPSSAPALLAADRLRCRYPPRPGRAEWTFFTSDGETASEAQTGGTLSCMNQHTGAGNFAEQERSRVEAELADLRRRRDQMRAELRDDADTVGDRGDAADAIQRAEDLAGIDEQIARLTWLLAGGNTAVEGQLPNGTQVTIRFPGDEPVRMRVVHFLEETPAGAEDTTLTADSPLGLALVGRKAGDTVIYDTPRGELQVDLLEIDYPK